mgnify:CR=1 FL=1
MKKTKKILTVFAVFLYIISFAYAQDYSLFSGKFYDLKEGEQKIEFEFYNGTYGICEGEEKTIPILVVNKDAYGNKYSLDAVGASWIALNAGDFSLPEKQSGVVFLNINPGENTNGRYDIKISGLSAIGNIGRDLNLDVNAKKCYSFGLELEKETDKVCGGINKKYKGELINNGEQKSDIELIANGPNWISMDKNIFSVAANGKQEFELNAGIPANAKGIFDVVVSAAIGNLPSIKSEKKLSIYVVPKYDCYKPDILTDEKITNYYYNSYVPVKIRNNGIKQAAYEIAVEAPNWIVIDSKKIILNPEQTANLNIYINPDAEVPEGMYPIKISLKFEDIAYSKDIAVFLTKENKFLKGAKSFFVFYKFYFISGILISLFVIFLIEFYRPLFKLLKSIGKPKRKK